MEFSKSKFLSLTLRQRHKKCAELIRLIYDGYALPDSRKHLEAYFEMGLWLGIPPLAPVSLKTLSDRYHYHLREANLFIREHRLLPNISKNDRSHGLPALPLAIYLDNLRSAHNVGSILRTIEAFSLGSVYFSASTPFVDQKQVKDAAMGAGQWITCHRSIPLTDLPRPYILLETSPQAIALNCFTFPKTFTLVIGNEEYGCSDTSLAEADYLLEIPLQGRKNSLNVANAFAITAAQIAFQNHLTKGQCNEIHLS